MIVDEIVSEVRAAREAYAARFGFDLKAICDDLRSRQEKSGRTIVRIPGRSPISNLSDAGVTAQIGANTLS